MSDNILNQLRNKRNRATVPERIDALVPKSTEPQVQQPVTVTENNNIDTLASLKAELEQYPETRRHSAIVLEKDLDTQLTQFCKDKGITVETFLEAAWTVVSADETLVKKITTEAKRRYDQRKRVGQIKRLITMLGNSY
jgi:predicted phage-related endonuclease